MSSREVALTDRARGGTPGLWAAADARSGSFAPGRGATWRPACGPTSTCTATCITRPSPSRPSSSPRCAPGSTAPWLAPPGRCEPADTTVIIRWLNLVRRQREYDVADTPVELPITDGPRKGETASLRQVTRRFPPAAAPPPARPGRSTPWPPGRTWTPPRCAGGSAAGGGRRTTSATPARRCRPTTRGGWFNLGGGDDIRLDDIYFCQCQAEALLPILVRQAGAVARTTARATRLRPPLTLRKGGPPWAGNRTAFRRGKVEIWEIMPWLRHNACLGPSQHPVRPYLRSATFCTSTGRARLTAASVGRLPALAAGRLGRQPGGRGRGRSARLDTNQIWLDP